MCFFKLAASPGKLRGPQTFFQVRDAKSNLAWPESRGSNRAQLALASSASYQNEAT
jgi:hypothetical protein